MITLIGQQGIATCDVCDVEERVDLELADMKNPHSITLGVILCLGWEVDSEGKTYCKKCSLKWWRRLLNWIRRFV